MRYQNYVVAKFRLSKLTLKSNVDCIFYEGIEQSTWAGPVTKWFKRLLIGWPTDVPVRMVPADSIVLANIVKFRDTSQPLRSRLWLFLDHNDQVSSSSNRSRWHHSVRAGSYALRSFSRQSPKGFPQNSANVCLVEHRSFPTSRMECSCRPPPFSACFPSDALACPSSESSSEHLCSAELQTKFDFCSACLSVCPFIPFDSGMTSAVDLQKSS